MLDAEIASSSMKQASSHLSCYTWCFRCCFGHWRLTDITILALNLVVAIHRSLVRCWKRHGLSSPRVPFRLHLLARIMLSNVHVTAMISFIPSILGLVVCQRCLVHGTDHPLNLFLVMHSRRKSMRRRGWLHHVMIVILLFLACLIAHERNCDIRILPLRIVHFWEQSPSILDITIRCLSVRTYFLIALHTMTVGRRQWTTGRGGVRGVS